MFTLKQKSDHEIQVKEGRTIKYAIFGTQQNGYTVGIKMWKSYMGSYTKYATVDEALKYCETHTLREKLESKEITATKDMAFDVYVVQLNKYWLKTEKEAFVAKFATVVKERPALMEILTNAMQTALPCDKDAVELLKAALV